MLSWRLPCACCVSSKTLCRIMQLSSRTCLLQSSAGTAVAVAQKLVELSVLEQLLELANASHLPVRVQASCQNSLLAPRCPPAFHMTAGQYRACGAAPEHWTLLH